MGPNKHVGLASPQALRFHQEIVEEISHTINNFLKGKWSYRNEYGELVIHISPLNLNLHNLKLCNILLEQLSYGRITRLHY